MTTRTYYFPRNYVARQIINKIIEYVGCSIGDLKVNLKSDTIRVPITCNEADVKKIEQVLKRYDLM